MELRHYALPIGAVVLAVGTVLFVLALGAGWLGLEGTLAFYVDLLPTEEDGSWQGWNTIVFLASPFVMLTGGWYVYEQVSLRRRFGTLLETPKKSEFRKEVPELEELARRLPPRFREQLKERREELGL